MKSSLELVQRHESCRLRAYLDTKQIITVGWGRNLQGKGVSQAEADFMLANDLAECEADLEHFWWFKDLDEVRKAVLIDMRYNLGLAGLLHFPNMISAIGRKDWETAAKECDDPHWEIDVGRRAKEDAQMLLTGEWPA